MPARARGEGRDLPGLDRQRATPCAERRTGRTRPTVRRARALRTCSPAPDVSWRRSLPSADMRQMWTPLGVQAIEARRRSPAAPPTIEWLSPDVSGRGSPPVGVGGPDLEVLVARRRVDEAACPRHREPERRVLRVRDRGEGPGRLAVGVGQPEVREPGEAQGGDRLLASRAPTRSAYSWKSLVTRCEPSPRGADQEDLRRAGALSSWPSRRTRSRRPARPGSRGSVRGSFRKSRRLPRAPRRTARPSSQVGRGREAGGGDRACRRATTRRGPCGTSAVADRGEDPLLRGIEVEVDEPVLPLLGHVAPEHQLLAVGREGHARVDVEGPLLRGPAERRDLEERPVARGVAACG